jgi:hypothetical protein
MTIKAQIRNHLGHCPPECRVKITHLGEVSRYGSPDPYDRSKDFWQFCGWVEDLQKELAEREVLRAERERNGSLFSAAGKCGQDCLPCGLCDECFEAGVLNPGAGC